jgi:hypothetical protein
MGVMQSPMSWNGAPAHASTPVVKKLVRLDVPVDKYPNVRMDFSSASVTLFSVLCHVMSWVTYILVVVASSTLSAVYLGHEETPWKELKLRLNAEFIFVDAVQLKILWR